jgi:hypothetical protein
VRVPVIPVADSPSERGENSSRGLIRVLVTAVPLAWAPFVLAHPDATPYGGIAHGPRLWLAVHIAQLAFAPLLAIALWSVLGGLHGAAATIAKVALVLWLSLFSAFDAIAGIATGRLSQHANQLPAGDRAAVGDAVTHLFEHDAFIGGGLSLLSLLPQPLWLVVAASTALALHRAGAHRTTVAGMWLSLLFATHGGPLAALGLVALAAALRKRHLAQLPTPTGTPARREGPTPPGSPRRTSTTSNSASWVYARFGTHVVRGREHRPCPGHLGVLDADSKAWRETGRH